MNETSFSGFLGIDISKDKFDAYCIGINGERYFLSFLSHGQNGV
jgi:hypothetical protein